MAIDTSKPLLDAFVKEYPFIKADLVRAGEEQLMNRILSETRAGQWLFDAISTSAMGASSVAVGDLAAEGVPDATQGHVSFRAACQSSAL